MSEKKKSQIERRHNPLYLIIIAIIFLLLADLSMDPRKLMDFSGPTVMTVVVGWISGGGGGGGVERGRGISESSRRQKAKGDKGKLLEDARATRGVRDRSI